MLVNHPNAEVAARFKAIQTAKLVEEAKEQAMRATYAAAIWMLIAEAREKGTMQKIMSLDFDASAVPADEGDSQLFYLVAYEVVESTHEWKMRAAEQKRWELENDIEGPYEA